MSGTELLQATENTEFINRALNPKIVWPHFLPHLIFCQGLAPDFLPSQVVLTAD